METLATCRPSVPPALGTECAPPSPGSADKDLYERFVQVSDAGERFLVLDGLALATEAITPLLAFVKREEMPSEKLASVSLSGARTPAEKLTELLAELKRHAGDLRRLDLNDNDMGDDLAEAVASLVSPQLKELNLSGNRLTDGGLCVVVQALAESGAVLEKLNLSHCRFGPQSARLVGALVKDTWCSSLLELRLSHCNLTDSSAPAIAEAVHCTQVLRLLDVSYNAYGLTLASPLSPSRPVVLPASLRVLSLSGNVFRPLLIRGLCNSLVLCARSLEEFSLAGCLDGDESLALFLSAVLCLPALRAVDFSRCNLTYRSGKLLGQKFLMSRALERISLAGNAIDVEGAADLASSFGRLKKLQHLDLDSCCLGNCGVVSVISSIVRGASPVHELCLSNNNITDVGVRDLCTLLGRDSSPKLDRLVLSKNLCTLQSRSEIELLMSEKQCDCVVVAEETPLDEVTGCSSYNSRTSSETDSLHE